MFPSIKRCHTCLPVSPGSEGAMLSPPLVVTAARRRLAAVGRFGNRPGRQGSSPLAAAYHAATIDFPPGLIGREKTLDLYLLSTGDYWMTRPSIEPFYNFFEKFFREAQIFAVNQKPWPMLSTTSGTVRIWRKRRSSVALRRWTSCGNAGKDRRESGESFN
jgi:hypothetical protein